MARVVAKKVPVSQGKNQKREMYAQVCYYFPQYTLRDVAKLPYRDVLLLLKTANRIEATRNYNLTAIAAAPHSKKQINVKKLLEHFEKQAKE